MTTHELLCDGQSWQGWTSYSIKQSMDNGAAGLTLSTTDRLQEGVARWNVRGGSEIEFLIGNQKVFDGFVVKYDVSLSASDHSVSIDANSKSIDIIDCAHEGPYFWPAGTRYSSIVSAVLSPYALEYRVKGDLGTVGVGGYRVEVEGAAFDIIKAIAEKSQKLLYTDSTGTLYISDGEDGDLVGDIVRGDYTDISSSTDMSKAVSKIIVKGQSNSRDSVDGEGEFNRKQRAESSIDSKFAARYRPIIHVSSDDKDDAENLNQVVRDRLSGAIVTASVTVKSHLNKSGKLWRLGDIVFVNEPLIEVRQPMIVHELDFSLDEGSGFKTVLSLRTPKAYGETLERSDARKSTGPLANINTDFFANLETNLADIIAEERAR